MLYSTLHLRVQRNKIEKCVLHTSWQNGPRFPNTLTTALHSARFSVMGKLANTGVRQKWSPKDPKFTSRPPHPHPVCSQGYKSHVLSGPQTPQL